MHVVRASQPLRKALAGVLALTMGATAAAAQTAPGVAGTAQGVAAAPIPFLDRLQARDQLPKRAYAPPERLLQPYARASLGPVSAFSLVAGVDMVDAPAAQALAQRVVDRELSAWRGPRPPSVPVIIVAEPNYGARAVPAGAILVSLGTFDADPNKGAATVDELALLLGHELSHILLGHLNEKQSMQGFGRALQYLGAGVVGYSALDRSHMAGQTLTMAGDANLAQRGLMGGLAATTLASDVIEPSFDRQHETEADQSGADLAHRAGFVVSAEEATHFVERHAADQERLTGRMQRLQSSLSSMGTQETTSATSGWSGQYASDAKSLVAAAQQQAAAGALSLIARRNVEHPDPAQRAKALVAYIQQTYPQGELAADGSILARDVASLDRVTRAPAVVGLLVRVRRAYNIRRDLVTGMNAATSKPADPAGAQKALASACSAFAPPPSGSARSKSTSSKTGVLADDELGSPAAAMTWEVEGAAAIVCLHDRARAQIAWRQAARADIPSLATAREYGWTVRGTPAQAELGSLATWYANLVGTSDPLLDLVVAADVAKGDTAGAETTAARCVVYNEGELYPSCALYLGYDPLQKTTPARTMAGQQAFATAQLQASLRKMTSLTKLFQ